MRRQTCIAFALVTLAGMPTSFASLDTLGPNGINSTGLTLFNGMPLNGGGIRVGQVEDIRPGITNYDSPANSNPTVIPNSITIQGGSGIIVPDMNIGDGHATRVASVIISTDTIDNSMPSNGDAPLGVAPSADLDSSAYVTTGVAGYEDAILTTQHIASISNMRAINHSWGKPKLNATDVMNGNSQLTLALDWLASEHDVLNVVSGYQGIPTGTGSPVPTDNFNGMTIGRSAKTGSVYNRVSTQNNFSEDAVGNRTSISLIAPGDNVETANIGNAELIVNGTSFAAPHVTGTVALLQQYAEERILNAGAPHWNANARRHEVMKAVLMNSADKIKDDGNAMPPGGIDIPDGGLLGMERTVVKQDGVSTWFQSDAYPDLPLGSSQFAPPRRGDGNRPSQRQSGAYPV